MDVLAWLRHNRHLVIAWAWGLLLVPTLLWWKESILWVAVMSVYANIAASAAAHEGRRARQERADVLEACGACPLCSGTVSSGDRQSSEEIPQ